MLFYLFIFSSVFFNAVSSDKILVLIDNLEIKNTHSIFFESIKSKGHNVEISMCDDASLKLFEYGELIYNHLILFSPSVEGFFLLLFKKIFLCLEFGGFISVQEITKFIDNGGNVLIAANNNIGDAIRELATEVGFEFDEEKTQVIDHHNYDTVLVI